MISLRNDSNSLRGSGLVKKSAKFLRLSTYSTFVVDAVGEFLEHLGDRDPLADEVADALATVQPIAVGARLAPSGCAAAAVPAALVGLDLRLESGDLGLGGRELLLEHALRGNLRLERRLRSRLGLVGAVRVVLVEDALHRERGRLEAVRLA